MIHSVFITEAVEDSKLVNQVIKDLKKSLNICKLAKYKSETECAMFYSAFFMNSLSDGATLTLDEWGTVYNTLLNDNVFSLNLSLFIVLYHPNEYTSMFSTLRNMIPVELEHTKNRIRFLSQTKATLMMIQKGFDTVIENTKVEPINVDGTKFLTVIRMTLDSLVMYTNTLLNREMSTNVNPDDIVITVHGGNMSESATAFIDMLRHCDEDIKAYNECVEAMNEGIVNKAKEAAQAAAVKMRKLSDAFDEKVTKAWNNLRRDQRNRKHKEIVGESLRITNEIKRLMISAPAAVVSPAIAVIIWTGTLMLDRATDKNDRDILVGQIKDELEICEEKIQIADRKGDDKERIELIRIRQKLIREYERVSKMRYKKNL